MDALEAIKAEITKRREEIQTLLQRADQLDAELTSLTTKRDDAIAQRTAAEQSVTALEKALTLLIEQMPEEEKPATRSGNPSPTLRVISRKRGTNRVRSSRGNRGHVWAGTAAVPKDSGVIAERADLVLELIREAPGRRISQDELTYKVQEFFEVEKEGTARSIASDSVAVLQERGVIVYTGEKASTKHTARKASPIWEARPSTVKE